MNKPPAHTRTTGSQARDQLLQAADALFYREGIRCVGVEAVVALAGVNKMSLYRQFDSKDALIAAYLEHRNTQYWQRFEASIAAYPDQPARQLVAFFAAVVARVSTPDYSGCPFVNAAVEFRDPASPVRDITSAHKQQLLERLAALARAAGARQPDQLAGMLALLAEGCYTAAQTYGAAHPVLQTALECATQLVAAATAPGAATATVACAAAATV